MHRQPLCPAISQCQPPCKRCGICEVQDVLSLASLAPQADHTVRHHETAQAFLNSNIAEPCFPAPQADRTVKWTDVEAGGGSARVELGSSTLLKRELDGAGGQRGGGSDSDSEPGEDSRRALKAGMRSSSAKTDASSQPAQSDADLLPAPEA